VAQRPNTLEVETGTFEFIVDGELVTYNNYLEIPEDLDFEHVIRFEADLPAPVGEIAYDEEGNTSEWSPGVILRHHTDEQHDDLAVWNVRLQQLMEKERARSM
jgi:hypothetical protein